MNSSTYSAKLEICKKREDLTLKLLNKGYRNIEVLLRLRKAGFVVSPSQISDVRKKNNLSSIYLKNRFTDTHGTCSKCGLLQTLDNFYKVTRKGESRYDEQCKTCKRKAIKECRKKFGYKYKYKLVIHGDPKQYYKDQYQKYKKTYERIRKRMGENLTDSYIKSQLRSKGYPPELITNPTVIEIKRSQIKIHRKIKNYGAEKSNKH